MAYTQLATFKRGTPPDIFLTYSYEMSRSGADILIKIKTGFSAVISPSRNANWFKQSIIIDGVTKQNEAVLKARGVEDWSAFEVESSTFRLQNKTSGTISLIIISETNDGDYTPSVSKTYSINVLPAASVLDDIGEITFEEGFDVGMSVYDESFTHNLSVSCGDDTIKTISGFSQANPVSFTDDEILSLYEKGLSLTLSFTLNTYSSGVLVGSDTKNALAAAAGTLHANVSGQWKGCVPYVKAGGVWKSAIAYTKVGGVWKRGI